MCRPYGAWDHILILTPGVTRGYKHVAPMGLESIWGVGCLLPLPKGNGNMTIINGFAFRPFVARTGCGSCIDPFTGFDPELLSAAPFGA